MLVSLKNFMNISMMPVKSLRSLLIQRSFGHIRLQRVLEEKTEVKVIKFRWSQPRRFYDEAPCRSK